LAYQASLLWPSKLSNDTILIEPNLTDGINASDIINDDEVSLTTKRDQTKYSLDGINFMHKSYFVHEIIARYINKHPQTTFFELKEIFNDTLLESRHRVRGLLFKKEEYDIWQRPDKAQRYGAKREGALLQSADGVQFYVNTQWTQASIQNIIEIAKNEGFDITIKI
jgi:hypothetical protein